MATLEDLEKHPKVVHGRSYVAKAARKYGAEDIKSVLDHPKVTSENFKEVAKAITTEKGGLEKINALLDHPKTDSNNLFAVARAARLRDLEGVGLFLNHPKTTSGNLKQLALTIESHGTPRPMEKLMLAWGHPKVTTYGLGFLIDAMKLHPIENLKPLLDHPKSTKDNLPVVCNSAKEYGVEPTLAAWDHPKTTLRNLNAVAGAAKEHGIETLQPLLNHKRITKANLGPQASVLVETCKRSKITPGQVIQNQLRFLNNGHMPTPELIKEYHERHHKK